MVTLICKLKFPDGAEVTGKVTAEDPYHSPEVQYAGPVNRLHAHYETATVAFLKLFFQNAAKKTGAEYSETETGQFEYGE